MNKNIKKILIKSKRAVFSEMAGNNPSIFLGEGYDFSELREYQIGDDIKKIDWIISAKLQKPFVKLYKEERELNVVIATMLNGSVYFGTKRFKQDLIAEIGAILGFSAIKNGDNLSNYIFADKLYSYLKPSKKLFLVNKMVEAIDEFQSINLKANYFNLADTLFKSIKRKSLIFVIGDFFDDFDFSILNKKHEVIAIVVRDRFEEEPKPLGFVNLIDLESGTTFEGDINEATINHYKAKVKEIDYKMYENFKKSGVRFTKIYTDEEPFIKLTKLFGRVF